MLDIKFIRENKDLIKEAARKKRIDVDIDELLRVDAERREKMVLLETKKAEQNVVGIEIQKAEQSETREALIEKMRLVKADFQGIEDQMKATMKVWQKLMLQVPNIPDMSVPEGDSDENNKEIKAWGEKPNFSFLPKSHIDLIEQNDFADLERGTKVAGFRGYFLKNDGALLNFALWQYSMEFFTQDPAVVPMLVPSLVRKETLFGSGYLPQGEEDLYATQDKDYLAGTAEVATMAMYSDEELQKSQLPLKMVSFSPCFRREAGSHGKDTRGLIRVHEFFKLEQVVLCEANHEESVRHHERINRNTEAFIESLNIPYHTVVNCGGDLGLGQVKKYDIELWVPSENKYREISSASYFHDFQTRRLNIRYRDDDGKLKFVHSLNATAAPTPRLLVSIIENFQQADGSIAIPLALQKYMGGRTVIRKR